MYKKKSRMLNEVKTRNIISGLIPPLSATIFPKTEWAWYLFKNFGHQGHVFSKLEASEGLVGHILQKVALHLSGQFTEKTQMVRKKTKFKDWRHHFVAWKNTHRNLWPTGIVERPIKSDDKMVRKAADRVIWEGKATTYIRPVTEMVLLME